MKTILSWLGAAMLLFSSTAHSQAIFQSYYNWANILNVDHGPYKKVRTWMNGNVPMYFAVGGANNPQGTNPMATLSCIDGSTGSMVFTKIISSPFEVTQTFEAVGVAVASNSSSPTIAVLCNYDNGTGKKQCLLYQFQSNGLLTGSLNLGEGTAVDVVYNNYSQAFDVLCEVTNAAGSDYELTGIDVYSFTSLWSKTYNWGAQDKPAALVIDNGDIVAAGNTEVGTDRQIFIVRTTSFGDIYWGQAFGFTNRRETISDIVFYYNTDGQFRYAFCGWDETTDQSFVGDVTIAGPQYGYSERYITSVNGVQKKMKAKSLARNEGNVFVCGLYDNKAPFVAMFLKNSNLTPQNFRFFDDAENVKEELFDIQYEFGMPDVVTVGYQQRNVAWGSSPAGQNYSWIMDMTPTGFATCKTSANAATAFFTGTDPFAICTTGNGDGATGFTGYANPTFFLSLDNCITPSRLMAPGEDEPATPAVASLYPNPGNGNFYLEGVFDENKNSVLHITDLSGRTVRETQLIAGTTKQNIDLTDLPDGVYAWTITVEGEIVKTEKLIIVR